MASTNPEPTTPTREPISITITDTDGGTIVWTPGEHGQMHLSEVPEEDLARVIDEVKEAIMDHAGHLTGTICGVVHPEVKDQTIEMLAALALIGGLFEPSPRAHRSVLSDPFGDDPFGPYGFGFPRGF